MNILLPLLIAATAADYWATPELKGMIPAYEHRLSNGPNPDEVIPYRLFVPNSASQDEKFPLIVWLHGAGESGRDNEMQLKFMEHTIFPNPRARERYRFAVLAPQCPRNQGWVWGPSSRDMLSITVEILDEVIAKYPIDVERITAVGISSGGEAVWEMANRYPDRLAAVAPMAAGLSSSWNSSTQRPVPTWAFLSPSDTTMSIQSIVARVEQLKRAGAPVELTLTSDHPDVQKGGLTHYCFVSGFSKFCLLPWLLSQSRGAQDAPAPGVVNWRWRFSWGYLWPRIGPTLIMCILAIGLLAAVDKYWRSKRTGRVEQSTEAIDR